MILTIIIISLAFYWLLRETDWLRIRLLVGEIPDPYIRKSWVELERDTWRISEKQKPFWLRHPDYMEPLCGRDWLENTMHVIPEYRIEIKAWNIKNTVTLKTPDCKLLKDLSVSMLKPNKEQRQQLTAQRKKVKLAYA